MRSGVMPIGTVTILNGATKSPVQSLGDMKISQIIVPAGSGIGGKTLSFVQVFNNVEYPVYKEDGTQYTIALVAGRSYMISEALALTLGEFKLVVNSAVAADSTVMLLGYNG